MRTSSAAAISIETRSGSHCMWMQNMRMQIDSMFSVEYWTLWNSSPSGKSRALPLSPR